LTTWQNHHSDRASLEAELLRQFQRAEGPYRRALSLLESAVPHESPSAEEITACLSRLEPIMRQTEEIEKDLGPCRQQWLQRGYQAGPALKTLFQQHEQILGTLIRRINLLEERMQQFKREVRPEVDSIVRHQQMQRAYQSAGKSASY